MLIYRRDTNTEYFPLYIDLPGGGKELDESPFETFQREVKEEFGISINEGDIVYAKKYIGVMDPTKDSYFFATKNLDSVSHPVIPGNEGSEFSSIEIKEYLELTDAINRQQDRVREYLNSL